MAHRIALALLRFAIRPGLTVADDPILGVRVWGLDFRNPIGLAAGFDKDARHLATLARLGFGFIEAGTVTPLEQSGNPRPRLFRLSEDQAIINRMGFNNRGIDAFSRALTRPRRDDVPVGANIGINKTGADPERDYPALIDAVSSVADYIVINVSSPNTEGLRLLQSARRLEVILRAARRRLGDKRPLLVKIAPDLGSEQLKSLVEACVEQGANGLVVSNTTVQRPPLSSRFRSEPGGLSGTPLFSLSTAILAQAYQFARGRLTLIGAGGVRTGDDAFRKIQAGAHLVQLYTGFVYGGPSVVHSIKVELAAKLRQQGFASIADAVGSDAGRLAREPA